MDFAHSVFAFVSSDSGQAQIAGALVAIVALAHALEWVVKLSPSTKDDEALAKFIAGVNALLAFLPRLKFGKVAPPVALLLLALAAPVSGCATAGGPDLLTQVGAGLQRTKEAFIAIDQAEQKIERLHTELCAPEFVVPAAVQTCADSAARISEAGKALDFAREPLNEASSVFDAIKAAAQ